MEHVVLQQIRLRRDHDESAKLIARSPGVDDQLVEKVAEIAAAFGDRPPGVACPGAIFAQPVGERKVAIVAVRDATVGPAGWAGLDFQILILGSSDYEGLGGDPFAIARAVPGFLPAPVLSTAIQVPNDAIVASPPSPNLEVITLPARPLAERDLERVRGVLKRVKAHALADDADPTIPPNLTIENAESPMLLGGVQVLVDGGKLIFERPKPDASVVEALWTLLPYSLRPKIWPASFAFSNELEFDVLVVPRLSDVAVEGYTTEEQAGDYPQGSYELALQTAAESGTADDLETVFRRRTSNDTLKLGFKLAIGLTLLVAGSRFLLRDYPPDPAPRAAAAASIVGVQDPWMALFQIDFGNFRFLKR